MNCDVICIFVGNIWLIERLTQQKAQSKGSVLVAVDPREAGIHSLSWERSLSAAVLEEGILSRQSEEEQNREKYRWTTADGSTKN